MSFCGIVSSYSFNIFVITQVLTVFTSIMKYNEYITDRGGNLTIPCISHTQNSLLWMKEINSTLQLYESTHILSFVNIQPVDAGVYVCIANPPAEYDETDVNRTTIPDEKEVIKIEIKVRTPPGPVSRIFVRISTIIGVLIWDWKKSNSGGYNVRSFTAEYRQHFDEFNLTQEWIRLDPQNIAPNARQLEIYHLKPNTTYEFRIWANNHLGEGSIVSTFATTLPEMTDEDVIQLILKDIEDFNPYVWIYAVSVFTAALIILSCTVCALLVKEWYEMPPRVEDDDWDSLELVPNIILNPGFCDPDDSHHPIIPYRGTIIFGEDVLSGSSDESRTDGLKDFKRKLSLFFTGDTVKRL